MAQLFTNNAVTTLAAGISAVAVELNVAPGKGDNFPVVVGGSGDFFVITMEDSAGNREFIRCDVRGAASDTLGSVTYPLQRGYWSTTARPWVLGDTVDLRWTAESMANLLTPEQSIVPGTDALYDIGSPTFRYRDLNLSRDASIAGALTVTGLTSLNGAANIIGNSSIAGNLDLTGTGNISLTGTVDGRDVATDGAKLDGVEAGATADQSNVEIETAYNAQVPAVTQVEAEAGTEVAIRRWSPLRVAQAIAALETDAAPGGLDTYVQFNNAGAFGGSANLTWDGTTLGVTGNASVSGALALEAFSEDAVQYTATTGTRDLDVSLGTYFYPSADLGTAVITFTFSNPAVSGRTTVFTLELLGADGATLTWPASVTWGDAGEPTWTAGVDIVSFSTRDGGTTWRAYPGGLNH